MNKHIVTYDLCKPNRDYDSIIGAIEAYSDNCRLTESCWLISTYDTAKEVRDYLMKFIDSDDKLAVIKLGDDWATIRIDKKATDWLTTNV